jgi:hypothetical protein
MQLVFLRLENEAERDMRGGIRGRTSENQTNKKKNPWEIQLISRVLMILLVVFLSNVEITMAYILSSRLQNAISTSLPYMLKAVPLVSIVLTVTFSPVELTADQ